MATDNKVKFNLKNVHYAPIVSQTDTELTYGPVLALPGAVNLSLEAQGDIEPFYADGIIYYQAAANNGYAGDLEIAMTPDEFRRVILMEQEEADGVLVENVNVQYKNFALGFQIDGDQNETLFWFFNCSVSRPTTEASTLEDTKTPQTDTLSISCAPAPNGNVRAKTTVNTSAEVRRRWFDTVRASAGAEASGATLMEIWPTDVPFEEKLGSKTVADLIGTNVSIAWNGKTGVVAGDIKMVKGWTEFSKTKSDGHFFPVLLDARYSGEEITCVATEEKSAKDLKWIIKLDDLMTQKEGKLVFKCKGVEIFTLDFSKANLLMV